MLDTIVHHRPKRMDSADKADCVCNPASSPACRLVPVVQVRVLLTSQPLPAWVSTVVENAGKNEASNLPSLLDKREFCCLAR